MFCICIILYVSFLHFPSFERLSGPQKNGPEKNGPERLGLNVGQIMDYSNIRTGLFPYLAVLKPVG
jgi:hypothetical protein